MAYLGPQDLIDTVDIIQEWIDTFEDEKTYPREEHPFLWARIERAYAILRDLQLPPED